MLQLSMHRCLMLLEMPQLYLPGFQPFLQKSVPEVLCHICQSFEVVSNTLKRDFKWEGSRHLCLDS